jgi:glutamate synthase domain-containing protein 3
MYIESGRYKKVLLIGASSKNFIKVMPTDYKNALAMLAAEEENKLNA